MYTISQNNIDDTDKQEVVANYFIPNRKVNVVPTMKFLFLRGSGKKSKDILNLNLVILIILL